MASLRDIRRRIGSVQNTRKITSAMRVVASAKMHQAQGRVGQSLAYLGALRQILTHFLLGVERRPVSALEQARPVARLGIVAVASDQGMCGTYNATVEAVLRRWVSENAHLGPDNLSVWPVGRKMVEAVKRLGLEAAPFPPGLDPLKLEHKPDYATARAFAQSLCAAFLSGDLDKVVVIYHHFKNPASQPLQVETYLPLDPHVWMGAGGAGGAGSVGMGGTAGYAGVAGTMGSGSVGSRFVGTAESDFWSEAPLVEPSAADLYEELMPKVMELRLYNLMLDASLSEHAARSLAMKVATDNADDLLSELRLLYNKTRQQAITSELLDIAGGSQD